ncbi:MAG: outer membrane beta-barrel protein [Bacteroidetes bacterium]|nr:outer membrane beta-barrel protein [Bacteroidota bacterium]
MKKILLVGLLFPLLTQAQWNVNLFGGFSNYIGDLQHRPYSTTEANGSFGAGLQYDLSGHFSVLTNFTYGKLSASDARDNKLNNRARNLSFETKITEWNLLLEYNLFDLRTHRITPYAFAGVAIYHFDPYAFDSLGNKVFLHVLSTEGEGLPGYPDRKPYSLTQFAIPFGGGIKFRISDRVTLAYEIGLRKLFTDHLDDVSTTYVDRNVLLAARGPKAVEMAYRGGELKNGAPYPGEGAFRGNPKHKDWYYMSGLRVTIALPASQSLSRHRHNGSVECPVKVY